MSDKIQQLTRNREELKELSKYMGNNDKNEYLSLLRAGASNSDLELFANNAITDYQINQSGMNYLQKESMADLNEYVGLNESEEQYIKKFYSEYYASRLNPPEDFRLLRTEEIIKESNRINNSRATDAMDVSKKQGLLQYITEDDWLENTLNKAKDDGESLTWEKVYSFIGYEGAMNFVISSMLEELSKGSLNPRLTAIRFYIKMERLRKQKNKDNVVDKKTRNFKDEKK